MLYVLNSSGNIFCDKSVLKNPNASYFIRSVRIMTQQTSLIFTISLILCMPISKVSCLALYHKPKTSFVRTEDMVLRDISRSEDTGTSQEYDESHENDTDPTSITIQEEGQNIPGKELSHQGEKRNMLSGDNFSRSEYIGTSQDYDVSRENDANPPSITIDKSIQEEGHDILGKELSHQGKKLRMPSEDNFFRSEDTATSQNNDESGENDEDLTSIPVDSLIREEGQNILGQEKSLGGNSSMSPINKSSNFPKSEWRSTSKLMAVISTTEFQPKDTFGEQENEDSLVQGAISMSIYQTDFVHNNGMKQTATDSTRLIPSTQFDPMENDVMDVTNNVIEIVDADTESAESNPPTRINFSTDAIAHQGVEKDVWEPTQHPEGDIAVSAFFPTKTQNNVSGKRYADRTASSGLLVSTVVQITKNASSVEEEVMSFSSGVPGVVTENLILANMLFYTQGPNRILNRTLYPKLPHSFGQSDEDMWKEACRQGSESCIKCKAIAIYCHYNFGANECFYEDHSHGNKLYECGTRFIVQDGFGTFYTVLIVLALVTVGAIILFAKIFHKYYMTKEPLGREEVSEMRSITQLIREKRNM